MDKSIKDGLHNSSMYLPGDKEFAERQTLCLERLYDFNQTRPSD
ncbi:maltose acetyltransferase domain-containing protein [Terribacillus saccharophilus]|nr:maltose acetyltransferase domain-containing protein [Terribacillus saccharophilus]